MGQTSAIEWTEASWNPWQGCTKVSPACTNCYMFADLKRYGRDGSVVVRSKPPTFNLPLKKRRDGSYAIAPGSKVFTCSWSDWFHKAADPWRDEAWAIIRQRRDVTFQIVTKRTERIAECLPPDWGGGYPNVWLTATVENQEWMDIRWPQLRDIPAAVHWLSIEPLLGPIRLPAGVDGVIVGGESGHKARPMHPAWVRSIRDQCIADDVPFFFKQHGEWCAFTDIPDSTLEAVNIENLPTQSLGQHSIHRVGKKNAGRTLDGRTWNQFPAKNA